MNTITVYTAIGTELTPEKEEIGNVANLLSSVLGKSLEETYQFIQDCEQKGRRIIHYHPELSDSNTGGWEYIGQIPDGSVYLG